MIARHLRGNNIRSLLNYADHHTTRELSAYAGRLQSRTDTRCVLLYFTPGDYKLFEKALIKFKAEKSGRGLIGKEKATINMAKKVLAD